jgi:photosystem II stability/assembly factor-like uncharacterized protein
MPAPEENRYLSGMGKTIAFLTNGLRASSINVFRRAAGLGCLAIACLHAQPTDSAAWKIHPFPDGGVVNFLRTDGDDLYAAVGSVIYRLAGGQGSWEPVKKGLLGNRIWAMEPSPRGMLVANSYSLHRLSEDRQAWTYLSAFPGLKEVNALYGGDSLVLAASDSAIFRSGDGGKSWSVIPVGRWVDFFHRHGRYLFAGSYHYLLRSGDEGRTWEKITAGFPAEDRSPQITSMISDGPRLFASVQSNPYVGLYVSSDSGSNWAQLGPTPPNANIKCMARSGSTLYIGTSFKGVFESADGGATWKAMRDAELVSRGNNTILPFAGRLWIGTNQGAAVRNAEGTAWKRMNAGMRGVGSFQNLACSGPVVAGVWAGTMFLSRDAGVSWTMGPSDIVSRTEFFDLAMIGSRIYLGGERSSHVLDTQDPFSLPQWIDQMRDVNMQQMAAMGDTLYYANRDTGTVNRWIPDADSAISFVDLDNGFREIPHASYTYLDGAKEWLRGYAAAGLFWEYRPDQRIVRLWRAPKPAFRSLSQLAGAPVGLVLGSTTIYRWNPGREPLPRAPAPNDPVQAHMQADSLRLDSLSLPFTLGRACHDGNRFFAVAEGQGVAEYVGQPFTGLAQPPLPRGAQRTAKRPIQRTSTAVFPSGKNDWRDAVGKALPR